MAAIMDRFRRGPSDVYGFVERTAGDDRVDCHVYAKEDGMTVPLDAVSDEGLERARLLFTAESATYDDRADAVIDAILDGEGTDNAEDWAGFTADFADDVTGGYESDLRATIGDLYDDVRDAPGIDVHVGSRDRDFSLVWEAVESQRGDAGPGRYVPGVAQLHLITQRRRATRRRRAMVEDGVRKRPSFIREIDEATSRFKRNTAIASAVGTAGALIGGDAGTAVAVAGFGAALGPVPGTAADDYAAVLSDGRYEVDWAEVKPYLQATLALD